jgi:hypothetical protein
MLVLLSVGLAYGQERNTGAGRFEVTALPTGGMFFTASENQTEPEFGNYVVGGAFAYNVNRWLGVEGEAGNLVGIRQTVKFSGQTLTNQHTPCMLGYAGNLLVHPWGSDRPFVPFATAGLGGLTMYDTEEVANLGITSKMTFLTGNVGGGAKWFAGRHWGVRGEYRLMLVDGREGAPAFFGRDSIRYGHRVSAGLLFTY